MGWTRARPGKYPIGAIWKVSQLLMSPAMSGVALEGHWPWALERDLCDEKQQPLSIARRKSGIPALFDYGRSFSLLLASENVRFY
jgi:hypothetical protein